MEKQQELRNAKYISKQDLLSNNMANAPKFRIGIGYDVHRFIALEDDKSSCEIKICGVSVKHDMEIEAHSDGDVGIHAVVDAMLGAMALGDIGQHFPPTDLKWKDRDSSHFLEFAVKQVKDKGYFVSNADIIIVCEKPKISQYRDSMKKRMSELLQVNNDLVGVKATTTERLDDIGHCKGIAAYATVQIQRVNWFYFFFNCCFQRLVR